MFHAVGCGGRLGSPCSVSGAWALGVNGEEGERLMCVTTHGEIYN